MEAGNPSEQERKGRLFYAHLYLGLFEEAEKHPEASLTHMKQAATDYAQSHYMGDVARIHVQLRTKASP